MQKKVFGFHLNSRRREKEFSSKINRLCGITTRTMYDAMLPFLIILFAPWVLLILWGTCSMFDGSLLAALNHLVTERDLLTSKWWPSPNWTSAYIIITFCLLQVIELLLHCHFLFISLKSLIDYLPKNCDVVGNVILFSWYF